MLLLASLLFYAWGEPYYIFLMLLSILVNWGIGLLLGKRKSALLLLLAILFNMGLLGHYKYYDFFATTLNALAGKELLATKELALPIGISFFTFQAMSYVIDLYRGKYKAEKNLFDLALYISFFPQLVAGPIVKYIDVKEQLHSRKTSPEKTGEGIRRLFYGLGKKVLIANTLAQAADQIYEMDLNNVTGAFAWLGAILYTLQIYYDFSGYSDMAIGLGKMFGFDFLENFNYPYLSRSAGEFWRRWHISLGTWFREYVYIPLGGNRKGTGRTCLNLFIVFAVTGLWHGASWNFIIWGVYYGVLLIAERLFLGKFLEKHLIFSHLYAVLMFVFGWVAFRVDDSLIRLGGFLKRMLLPWEFTSSDFAWQEIISHQTLAMMIVGVLGCGLLQWFCEKMFHTSPWTLSAEKRMNAETNANAETNVDKETCMTTKTRTDANIYMAMGKDSNLETAFSVIEYLFCIVIAVCSILYLASNAYNPFIYFRF